MSARSDYPNMQWQVDIGRPKNGPLIQQIDAALDEIEWLRAWKTNMLAALDEMDLPNLRRDLLSCAIGFEADRGAGVVAPPGVESPIPGTPAPEHRDGTWRHCCSDYCCTASEHKIGCPKGLVADRRDHDDENCCRDYCCRAAVNHRVGCPGLAHKDAMGVRRIVRDGVRVEQVTS